MSTHVKTNYCKCGLAEIVQRSDLCRKIRWSARLSSKHDISGGLRELVLAARRPSLCRWRTRGVRSTLPASSEVVVPVETPLHTHFLVGGLEHQFYFPIYWEYSSQLTFIFFRGVAQPPTSFCLFLWVYGWDTIGIAWVNGLGLLLVFPESVSSHQFWSPDARRVPSAGKSSISFDDFPIWGVP